MDFFNDIEDFEYFCGLILADGHMRKHTRNRGDVQIELRESDNNILYDIQNRLNIKSNIYSRKRRSNFSNCFKTNVLTICNHDFCEFLNENGIPYGKKDNTTMPNQFANSPDFWRGFVDGDGSLGKTKNNRCFLSLVIKNEDIKYNFTNLINKITGRVKKVRRNKRDDIYNISLFCELAQDMVKFLNYESCSLSLNRKKDLAAEVLSWKRPLRMRKKILRKWTQEEDNFISNHNLEESIRILGRSGNSIKMRKWRILNQ